jgi:ABC-type transport system substrate-binding protein
MSITTLKFGNHGIKHIYDPEQAKKILDECGFDYNYTVSLLVLNSGNNTSVAEIVRSMWSKIGVKAEINAFDYAGTSAVRSSDIESIGCEIYGGAITDGNLLGNYANFVGPSSETVNTTLNNQPEAGALISKLLTSTDDTKTLELHKELLLKIQEEGLMTELAHPFTISAVHGEVEGFVPPADNLPILDDVTVWVYE